MFPALVEHRIGVKIRRLIQHQLMFLDQDDDIVRKIINTNIDAEEDALAATGEMKVKFRTGPKDQRNCHVVLEVAPRTREILLKMPRLYINYTSHTIKDYLVVARGDLGHTTKFCNVEEICTHCRWVTKETREQIN